jgi:hypothetical protein
VLCRARHAVNAAKGIALASCNAEKKIVIFSVPCSLGQQASQLGKPQLNLSNTSILIKQPNSRTVCITRIRHRTSRTCIGYVSDTDSRPIQFECVSDTPRGISDYFILIDRLIWSSIRLNTGLIRSDFNLDTFQMVNFNCRRESIMLCHMNSPLLILRNH